MGRSSDLDGSDALDMHLELIVNGVLRSVDTAGETPLLSILRDDLGLMGARFGCGFGACGACYILVDGEARPACSVHARDVAGRAVTTIEGLASGDELHAVQRAFIEMDAMQCGFCTTGMIMSTVALLRANSHPTTDEIRSALAPHLCRCGIYGRAVRAVQRAAGTR